MSRVVKKPDERKDELLDIATKLFIEKGYENTSVRDIYTQVNGSFGMFYHHFKSKEEVLEEVNKKMMAQRFEPIKSIIIDSDLSGIEKLRKVLSLAIISSKQEINTHSNNSYQKNPQLLVMHMHDTLGVASDLLSSVIEDGIKDGTIQTERPHELSQMILLFLNVWVNPWLYQWSPEKLRNIFVFMKDVFDKMGVPALSEDMLQGLNELLLLVQEDK
ncbi:TetR/AcrR family transcriptional regulator [Proteiniborus sp. MB09-C3]|uniref:TetR/AcrR family transcriptional regulator n=1 Tax=Proteiniborus sp. MB09-C3 TaxID=3050072 RepID=UPI002554B6B7|nr:TetR/AcrR family transcriptional regulator [Proteiniborus sp. MB09-C3]WIV13655.1 TetR/AcrR family transcriptional regulator [Proteiniborus sp. MB09-C3]